MPFIFLRHLLAVSLQVRCSAEPFSDSVKAIHSSSWTLRSQLKVKSEFRPSELKCRRQMNDIQFQYPISVP